MTLHNDGINISLDILIRQDLTIEEKMTYGVIKTFNLGNKYFNHDHLVCDKLGIGEKKAISLMRSLKNKGLI